MPMVRIQYHKPSYTVEPEGRIVPTDRYGNKLYHQPGFKVDGDKVYEADQYGNQKQQAYVVKPPKATPATEQAKAKEKAGTK